MLTATVTERETGPETEPSKVNWTQHAIDLGLESRGCTWASGNDLPGFGVVPARLGRE